MSCLVINGVASQPAKVVICVRIEIIRRLVSLVNALVVVEMKRMNETSNGHILVFKP